jgi:hypothetical protein
MSEVALLNKVGQLVLDEVKKTFAELNPSRGFNGQGKPVAGQLPPIFASKNASKTYVNSLRYRIVNDPENDELFIQIFSTLPEEADYGKYIEGGRVPGFWPNINAIRIWMGAKNVVPQPLPQKKKDGSIVYKIPTLKQLNYLISRSIFREGIFPYPYVDITYQRIEQQILKELEPAAAEIVRQLVLEKVVFMVNPQRQTR